MLTLWVGVANADKGSINLTLSVGGSIITGDLIGIAEYLEGIAAEFDDLIGAELGDTYRALAAKERQRVAAADVAEQPSVAPTFIQLKNAKVYVGGRLLPDKRGLWWRGRLDSVDGWTFGGIGTG